MGNYYEGPWEAVKQVLQCSQDLHVEVVRGFVEY